MQKDVDALVRQGLPLARSLARQIEHRLGGAVASDELLSLAQPVLFEAALSYDPEKAPFAPYLAMKLRWAMIDLVRKLKGRPRAAQRAAACMAVDRLTQDDTESPAPETLKTEEEYQADLRHYLAKRAAAMALAYAAAPADAQETPEDEVLRSRLHADLHRAVKALPDKQRALVERHYFGDENFDAIAEDIGISKSWASRVHAQAIESLAKKLREEPPEET